MSQASPVIPVPSGGRAVTVFVLLLLVGVAGSQTRDSLRCMAARLTEHVVHVNAPCRVLEDSGPSVPGQFVDCTSWRYRQGVRVCLVSSAMWPPPRGPDPLLS